MDLPVLARRRGLRSLFRRGPHDAEILRLAVPAFGALVAEPLFLLGDSAIVGRIGTIPLGGLGVASQVLITLVNISIFLAYGTTAAVARQLGAGNRRAAIQQGIDGLWLAAGIGAGRARRRLAARALSSCTRSARPRPSPPGPSPTCGSACSVRRPCSPCWPAPGVLRGLQDTRTPLAVAVCASAVNLVVNAIFVLGLHWGLAGSAAGTAIVQNAAALAYLTVVARGARRAGVALRPDGAGVRGAAFAGASLVVRTLALQVVLVVTTALAARMGNAAIAAHQIAFRIWSLLALALDAIAIAGQAITGKYLGAGDVAGARAATARMITWGAVYGVVFGLVILAARPFLPAVFATAPPVPSLLLTVLLIVAAQQPVAGVVFVLDGVLIGAGDQDYLALAGLATLAVFGVAAACVHAWHGGLVALWLAYSVWLAARFVTLTLRARGSAWLVTGAVR